MSGLPKRIRCFRSLFLAPGVRRLREERGNNLVETALSLPIFFLVLFGIVQMGYAFYTYQCVANASREASRWASVRGSTSCSNTPNLTNCGATAANITSFVGGLGLPGLNGSLLTVTTSWLVPSAATNPTWSTCAATSGCNKPGNQVQVTVAYPFNLAIPFWKKATVNISSSSEMVIAQ
jgi:Flp pilus assembly protein TadG